MKIVCLPDCFIKPDTALLRNGEPFYAPSADVSLRRGRVVRICRLAKCVEERFAHRCYDAVAEAVDFTMHGEFGRSFDHSLAVAPSFEPLDASADAAFCGEADRAIAHITRHVTLKIGDYIFLPSGDPEPLTSDTVGLWFEVK